MRNYTDADLDETDRVMLDFCVKLTLQPQRMSRTDVEELRRVGFDDAGVSDIVQVAALFNYYNRVADGLGIDSEPDWS